MNRLMTIMAHKFILKTARPVAHSVSAESSCPFQPVCSTPLPPFANHAFHPRRVAISRGFTCLFPDRWISGWPGGTPVLISFLYGGTSL
ncbi:hypothetical protein Pcar_3201 [Syntrophotalea carbinolica DSM 2380]|uniref:Uncharacterized protein n=1 Tax=Syntrophotalea carbinolica (strain DSM 2380 / NBRC 103641 / GraBd1) TaxID=338963 RepID=Q0C6W6_SYNC1|nr:hypothetical protein Pcar_3201 [Syntrophotalea carbinolica DSM 2380]